MNGNTDLRNRTELTVPYDVDLERSVLTEAMCPLHALIGVDGIETDDFYDRRHRRIYSALREGTCLHIVDRDYVDDVDRWAYPVVATTVDRFRDLAWRRFRLAWIERERLALCDLGRKWEWPTDRPPPFPHRVKYALPAGIVERLAAIDPTSQEPFS